MDTVFLLIHREAVALWIKAVDIVVFMDAPRSKLLLRKGIG
jgi:hypothetical protein